MTQKQFDKVLKEHGFHTTIWKIGGQDIYVAESGMETMSLAAIGHGKEPDYDLMMVKFKQMHEDEG